ncbi:hypothetical protein MMC18_002288 [Xylographa bjoerkii]|nr:hypothetical protein [Xylographa bjoerkii]
MIFEWHLTRSISRQATFPFPSTTESCSSAKLDFTTFNDPTTKRTPKRFRSQTDVDGEGSGNLQKKKRRLRLDLITSRLSRPFATPTTHIVGRRTTKFAIGVRQKVWCRDLLRKAAIMNGIRMMSTSTSTEQMSNLSKTYPITKYYQPYRTDIDTVNEMNNRQSPSASLKNLNLHAPPAPSPLSLSNDDEWDDQDSIYDDQDWEDADSDFENTESVNSDFNMRESASAVSEDCEFATQLEHTAIIQAPQLPSSADVSDLGLREDRRNEMSLAQFDTRNTQLCNDLQVQDW